MSVVGDSAAGSVDAGQVGAVLARRRHRRTPAPHRAPTAARRVRCAPDARPAPCPSCPIQSRRCAASCVRSARSRARQQPHDVAAMTEQDQHGDHRRADVNGAQTRRHPLDDRQHDRRDDRSERHESRSRDDERKCRGGDAASESASARRTRRSRSRRPCRRGTAARPDRCDRPPPPRRRPPAFEPPPASNTAAAPFAMSAIITAIADRQSGGAIHVGGADVAAADAAQIDPAARSARRDNRSAASRRRNRSGWRESFRGSDQRSADQSSIVRPPAATIRLRYSVTRSTIDVDALDLDRLQNLRPVDAGAGHLDAAEREMRQKRRDRRARRACRRPAAATPPPRPARAARRH